MTEHKAMYMAMELSAKKWHLCFWAGSAKRKITVDAGNLEGTLETIKLAKRKLGLAADCQVYSCYEAGRDGFWIHRFLTNSGINNQVVDSASIEVNRRQRRQKTDRLDADKLVTMLFRYWELNERGVWKIVQVPSKEQEDDRQLHRDIERLKAERKQHNVRIRSLLVKFGIKVKQPHRCNLSELRDWCGEPLPEDIAGVLIMEQQRLKLVINQIKKLEEARDQRIAEPRNDSDRKAEKLIRLKAVGPVSGWCLAKEFFGWREFQNRKQVGGLAGLTGTHYSSGDSTRDQGISKAGNPRVRHLMVELAWTWLRLQPQSELSKWYNERYANSTKRMRRVGIVALARKLLIALWKYVEKDEIPEGAVLNRV